MESEPANNEKEKKINKEMTQYGGRERIQGKRSSNCKKFEEKDFKDTKFKEKEFKEGTLLNTISQEFSTPR